MDGRMRRALGLAVVLAVAPAAYGCSTVQRTADQVGSGAAEVATINQNAETVINAPIADVDRRARAALASMGLTVASAESEDAGTEREFEARNGDNVAHVKLESRGTGSTHVAVSYRRNTVDYSKTEAQRIVDRIQAQR